MVEKYVDTISSAPLKPPSCERVDHRTMVHGQSYRVVDSPQRTAQSSPQMALLDAGDQPQAIPDLNIRPAMASSRQQPLEQPMLDSHQDDRVLMAEPMPNQLLK